MNATVVVPVYNQAFALSLTLFGFCKQEAPYRHCPIIVVDDGSTEPIEAVVEAYKEDLNLTYLRLERSGRAVSRNRGAAIAEDGLLIFCDADRIPHPQFIKAHVEAQEADPGTITIGQVREMYVHDPYRNRSKVLDNYLHEKGSRIPQYCQLVYQLFDSGGTGFTELSWIAAFSGNLSLPVSTFREIGGFDEHFTEWGFEHFEMGYRCYRMGKAFRYEAAAVNVHIAHPREEKGFYQERMEKSHRYFAAKHPTPVVQSFLSFMQGKQSMQELLRYTSSTNTERLSMHPPLYVRITNF